MNIHRLEFMYQELQRIRHRYHTKRPAKFGHIFHAQIRGIRQAPREPDRSVRHRTHKQFLRWIIYGNHTRRITNRHVILIPAFHHGFAQEIRGPVRNQNIAFHFTYTQTTIIGAATHRLARERGSRSQSAIIHLVLDHVFQSHIIRRTNIDFRLDLLSSHPII